MGWQFFWTEIQAAAGYAGAGWATMGRCNHDVAPAFAPWAEDARIGRPKNMDGWRALRYRGCASISAVLATLVVADGSPRETVNLAHSVRKINCEPGAPCA